VVPVVAISGAQKIRDKIKLLHGAIRHPAISSVRARTALENCFY
jgi:hypothetical protein